MEQKLSKIKKLLIGGLVSTIVCTILYFLAFMVMLFVYGFAAVLAAIITAMFGGEGNADISPEGKLVITLLLILAFVTLFMIIVYIVALVLSRKMVDKKKRIAVCILAIVGNIPTIFIPVGLIAGIIGLKIKEDEPVDKPVVE